VSPFGLETPLSVSSDTLTVMSIGSASVVAHADTWKIASEIAQQVAIESLPGATRLWNPQPASKTIQLIEQRADRSESWPGVRTDAGCAPSLTGNKDRPRRS
jgi:hypothetical protein